MHSSGLWAPGNVVHDVWKKLLKKFDKSFFNDNGIQNLEAELNPCINFWTIFENVVNYKQDKHLILTLFWSCLAILGIIIPGAGERRWSENKILVLIPSGPLGVTPPSLSICPLWPVRVRKWDVRVLRTGTVQNGPAHGSEPLSSPVLGQSAGIWRVVAGKLYARALNLRI